MTKWCSKNGEITTDYKNVLVFQSIMSWKWNNTLSHTTSTSHTDHMRKKSLFQIKLLIVITCYVDSLPKQWVEFNAWWCDHLPTTSEHFVVCNLIWIEGYSMAVAQTAGGSLTIVGAPRYQHIGTVIAARTSNTYKKINPYPKQVCVARLRRILSKQCRISL